MAETGAVKALKQIVKTIKEETAAMNNISDTINNTIN